MDTKKPAEGRARGSVNGPFSYSHKIPGMPQFEAPIWDLPAAFVYCCPVTVLEWDSGHVFVLTPVTKPGSPVIHFSTPRIMIPKLIKTISREKSGRLPRVNLPQSGKSVALRPSRNNKVQPPRLMSTGIS